MTTAPSAFTRAKSAQPRQRSDNMKSSGLPRNAQNEWHMPRPSHKSNSEKIQQNLLSFLAKPVIDQKQSLGPDQLLNLTSFEYIDTQSNSRACTDSNS